MVTKRNRGSSFELQCCIKVNKRYKIMRPFSLSAPIKKAVERPAWLNRTDVTGLNMMGVRGVSN